MVMPLGGFGNATGGVGRAENLIATGNVKAGIKAKKHKQINLNGYIGNLRCQLY